MRMRNRLYLIVLSVLLSGLPCAGQRQSQGRSSIDAAFVMDFTSGFHPSGGRLTWSLYGFDHHLSFGLDVLHRDHRYTEPAIVDSSNPSIVILPGEEHVFPSYEIVVLYGYKYRIWSTRSRSLILTAGIYGGTGVVYCKDMSSFAKTDGVDGIRNYGEAGFVQEFMPDVTLEFFPLKNVSFCLTVCPKVYVVDAIGGDKRPWFRPFAGVGTKFYL